MRQPLCKSCRHCPGQDQDDCTAERDAYDRRLQSDSRDFHAINWTGFTVRNGIVTGCPNWRVVQIQRTA